VADTATLKPYDRLMGSLDGMPDVAKTRPTPVRVVTPLLGTSETFIVQTFRQREEGDVVFIEHTGPEGFERYYLPAPVVAVLMRQQGVVERINRKRAAQKQADERKAAGIQPAFLKSKAVR
jgi:hypothetical protein